MPFRNSLLLAAFCAFALCCTPSAHAADNLQAVLSQLDQAAANFHTTSADFTFDTETLQPIADSDIQKGVAYYERTGKAFKMAAHINQPAVRVYSFVNGQLTYFDQPSNQVTRFTHYSKYESYFMLGFGASGKDLAALWNITDGGPETIDGVKTEKLELIARDPTLRKNLNKVTIWVDPTRAISLRVRFDESSSVYRICSYSHFRINQSLPRDAFTFKTNAGTTYSNR